MKDRLIRRLSDKQFNVSAPSLRKFLKVVASLEITLDRRAGWS